MSKGWVHQGILSRTGKNLSSETLRRAKEKNSGSPGILVWITEELAFAKLGDTRTPRPISIEGEDLQLEL